MNGPEQETLLRCYELAAPGAVAKYADVVTKRVRQALALSDDARYRVAVSPYSGWITYVDEELLWRGRGRLPRRQAAAQRAEDALRRLRAALAPRDTQLPSALQRLSVFPERVRPLELVALPRPDDGAFDHWLFRGEPLLVLGDRQPDGPVLGTGIEMRIGANGAVVGLTCRWRALTGRTTSVPRRPPAVRPLSHHAPVPAAERPSDEDHGGERAHDHHHRPGAEASHGDDSPVADELIFVLQGEGIPQLLLTPFYRQAGGHVVSLASACDLSLTVDLWGDDVAEGMRLTALATGGSGEYEYQWGVAPLDDPFAVERTNGRTERLGGADERTVAGQIVVPVGAYLVAVQVHDRETGAFQHFQQHVFCSGLRRNGEPAVPATRGFV